MNTQNNQCGLGWVIFAALVLGACAPLTGLSSGPASDDSSPSDVMSCIPPITTFAYPITRPDADHMAKLNIPYGEWESEADAPLDSSGNPGFAEIGFAVPKNGQTEIWLMRWERGANQPQFLVYETGTKSWKVITDPYDFSQPFPGAFLITDDGSLWGISWHGESAALSRFNEEDLRFELVGASDGQEMRDIQRIATFDFSPSMFLDHSQTLWSVGQGELYSFKPSTGAIERHVLDMQNADVENDNGAIFYAPEEPAIKDGAIAFELDETIYLLSADSPELFEYHRDSGRITRSVIPVIVQELGLESANIFDAPPNPGGSNAYGVFVDHAGRLWVNDYGWMDSDGTWNVMLRSPVFISEEIEILKHIWYRPNLVLESSDNSLWFRSPNGLAKLNPDSGEWCWVSQVITNVIEDQDRNLWILVGGKLYRHSLQNN
jgi:hypothetical protein